MSAIAGTTLTTEWMALVTKIIEMSLFSSNVTFHLKCNIIMLDVIYLMFKCDYSFNHFPIPYCNNVSVNTRVQD
jgi:hypothetical protein